MLSIQKVAGTFVNVVVGLGTNNKATGTKRQNVAMPQPVSVRAAKVKAC